MPPTSSESIRITGGIPMSTRTDWTPTYDLVFNPIALGKTAISEATISRRPSFGLGGLRRRPAQEPAAKRHEASRRRKLLHRRPSGTRTQTAILVGRAGLEPATRPL